MYGATKKCRVRPIWRRKGQRIEQMDTVTLKINANEKKPQIVHFFPAKTDLHENADVSVRLGATNIDLQIIRQRIQ